jgi:biopolymer transport protein ExbD
VLAVTGIGFWSVSREEPSIAPAMMAYTDEAVAEPGNLIVEVDQQGQTHLGGRPTPLETIEATFKAKMRHGVTADSAQIHFVEGCPFEHVQKVRDMFRRLGYENPEMTPLPPQRQVVVRLDAEGNATIDGEPAENVRTTLHAIADRHGRRATVLLQVDPQCPADAVSRILSICEQARLGAVKIAAVEGSAESTE